MTNTEKLLLAAVAYWYFFMSQQPAAATAMPAQPAVSTGNGGNGNPTAIPVTVATPYNGMVVTDNMSNKSYIVLNGKTWYLTNWNQVTPQQKAKNQYVKGVARLADWRQLQPWRTRRRRWRPSLAAQAAGGSNNSQLGGKAMNPAGRMLDIMNRAGMGRISAISGHPGVNNAPVEMAASPGSPTPLSRLRWQSQRYR